MRLKQVLAMRTDRGHPPLYSIASNATLRDVATYFCDHGIGAALVHQTGSDPRKYVGIISERDIIRLCCDQDQFQLLPVAEVMSREMVVAKLTDDVEYVMRVMRRRHIRHIPVVDSTDEPKIVGFLSIRDLLYADIDEKTVTIHEMSDFLGGTYRNDVY